MWALGLAVALGLAYFAWRGMPQRIDQRPDHLVGRRKAAWGGALERPDKFSKRRS
jgi:hypothetical protein